MTTPLALHSALAGASDAIAQHLREILVSVRSPAGGGSGTAWSSDGLVVTNHHVVPQDRAGVELSDGREFDARVVSRDPEQDLALLRIEAELVPAVPGDPATLRPGSLVFAIGNPWGRRGTLTSGIVLARQGNATSENAAPIREVIRADLRLAPGNSGGPLVDAGGRLVGINSMIAGGMAIAIPVSTIQSFVARQVPAGRGVLGVTLQPVPIPDAIAASYALPEAAGLMLTGVDPGSPADQAGLLPGDVLLGLGAHHGDVRRVARELRAMRAGSPVELALLRGGRLVQAKAVPTTSA